MQPRLAARRERWPLKRPFRISRGEKTAADVVVVEITRNGVSGLGECVPYARYGESVESVLEEVAALAPAVADGLTRTELAATQPPGAARNAVDCAMWDLEARQTNVPVTERLGAPLPERLVTAVTVGIDTPDRMAQEAAQLSHVPLLKVKLNDIDPMTALAAVRMAAPEPALIVDPNESWSIDQLRRFLPMLKRSRVALLEQPVPASDDTGLELIDPPVPICADEAVHVADDLARVAARYQAINIKLDKTGGLTAALALCDEARTRGLRIMAGCMVCTSLGIAPALHVARLADFVDLDGPWWLKNDREPALRIRDGYLTTPTAGWGHGNCTS